MESNGYDQKDIDSIVKTIRKSLNCKIMLNRFDQQHISAIDNKVVYQNFIQEIKTNVDIFLKNIIFTPKLKKNNVQKQLQTFLFHGDYTYCVDELTSKITDEELMPKFKNVIEPYLSFIINEYIDGKVKRSAIKQNNLNMDTENMEIIESTSKLEFLDRDNDVFPFKPNISPIQDTMSIISNENDEYNILESDISTSKKLCQSPLDLNIIKNHKDEEMNHSLKKKNKLCVGGKKLKWSEFQRTDNEQESPDTFLSTNKIPSENGLIEVTPENFFCVIEYTKLCLDYIESVFKIQKDSDEKIKLDIDSKLNKQIELVDSEKVIKPFNIQVNSNSSASKITKQHGSNEKCASLSIKLKKKVNGHYMIIKNDQKEKRHNNNQFKKSKLYDLYSPKSNDVSVPIAGAISTAEIDGLNNQKSKCTSFIKINTFENTSSNQIILEDYKDENEQTLYKEKLNQIILLDCSVDLFKGFPPNVDFFSRQINERKQQMYSLQLNKKKLDFNGISDEKKKSQLVPHRSNPFVKKLDIDPKQNSVDNHRQNIKRVGTENQEIKTSKYCITRNKKKCNSATYYIKSSKQPTR